MHNNILERTDADSKPTNYGPQIAFAEINKSFEAIRSVMSYKERSSKERNARRVYFGKSNLNGIDE